MRCGPVGNLAGDCQEWRDVVEANGAIPPLVRLLLGPLQQEHSALTIEAAQTAAWALSNLLHGSGRQVSSYWYLKLSVSSLW